MTRTHRRMPEPPRLDIDITSTANSVIRMAVSGEVDLTTAAGMSDTLLGSLQVYRPTELDLDLSGLTFLDASGVAVLFRVYLAADAAGCRVRLRGPLPVVRRVLEITGVSAVCEVAP